MKKSVGKSHCPSEVYYYTSIETLRFILRDANIYATNLKYMNDSEEYTNGLRELAKIINKTYGSGTDLINNELLEFNMKEASDSYSISFSTQRDLLSQWSMYAGESGVSLRLNFRNRRLYEAYAAGGDGKERETVTSLLQFPEKVYYFTEKAMKPVEYLKTAKAIVKKIESSYEPITIMDMESHAVTIWKKTTPYVKRYEFNAEGEYRLVFTMSALKKNFRVDYRNDHHVLKPYLDVKCEGGWPIEEILVGPGFNQDVVYDSLKHFLSNAELTVPNLTGREFRERGQEFFTYNKKIPLEVKLLWDSAEGRLKNEDADKRYREFCELVKCVLEKQNVKEDYKKYISERHMIKQGIILGKSEIPYIF